MSRRGVVSLVVGALLTAPAVARASEAVTVRENPAHTSSTSDPAVTAPLRTVWSRNLGKTSAGASLVAGGRVFAFTAAADGSTSLTALSAADGSVLWSRDASRLDAYDAGRVFLLSGGGTLQAVDAATGATQWTTQLPGQYSFSAAPTATGGLVYASGAGSGGTLYAVRESDGAVVWTQSVMNGDDSSPAVDAGRVFVSYSGPQTYAFDAASGAPLWHYSGCCEGGGGDTPAVADGRVWARDFAGDGYVYGAADGKLLDHFNGGTPPPAGGPAPPPPRAADIPARAPPGAPPRQHPHPPPTPRGPP